MITNDNIWIVMVGIAPLVASLTWIFLLMLGLRDSKTETEREVRLSFLYYLLTFSIGYSLLKLYAYRPDTYINLTPLVNMAFMLTPVIFYKLIWLLTNNGKSESFSYYKHLSVVVLLTLVLSAWIPLVPTPVQASMIAGQEFESKYNILYLIFKSRPLVQLIFISVYVCLSLRRLIKYMQALHKTENSPKNLSRQLLYAMISSFMVLVVSAMLLFRPQQDMFNTLLPITLIMFFVVLHSIVGYSIIRSGFMVLKVSPIYSEAVITDEITSAIPKKTVRQIAERVITAEGKVVTIPLSRERFEEYMREHKSYLNPDLKITDLIEPIKANRTVISNFVNQTYGMNFNRYINHLRIQELEQLKKLPENKDIDTIRLLPQAGFSSMRNYTRAIVAEQDKQYPEDK